MIIFVFHAVWLLIIKFIIKLTLNVQIFGVKLNSDNYRLELNPLDTFDCMLKRNKNPLLQKDEKISNSVYNHKRRSLINSIMRLNNKLDYSNKVHYLAIYYADLILLHNHDIKLDLTLLCCLLIASKNKFLINKLNSRRMMLYYQS